MNGKGFSDHPQYPHHAGVRALRSHVSSRQPSLSAIAVRSFSVLWAVVASLAYFATDVPEWVALLNIVIPTIYFVLRREIRGVEIAINITMAMVIVLPAFGFWLQGQPKSGLIVCVSAIFFAAVEKLVLPVDKSLITKKSRSSLENFRVLQIMATTSFAINFISDDRFITLMSFMLFYAIALQHFSRLCATRYKIVAAHTLIFAMLVAFAILSWDRGGRIQFGTFVIAPIIIGNIHGLYRFRSWWSFALGVPTFAAGQLIRVAEGESIGNVLTDGSAADPVRRFLQIFDMITLLPFRLGDFLGQCELFFFGWVPRDWWPNKPVGLGYSLVDDLLSRRGFSLNHSIAPSYLGESLWYLGYYFPIGLLIAGTIYVLTVRALAFATKGNVACLAIVYAYISNYAWGGFNTFGTRAWFLIIPLLLYLAALSLLPSKLNAVARAS